MKQLLTSANMTLDYSAVSDIFTGAVTAILHDKST